MFVYNKMTKGGILACMIIIYWKKETYYVSIKRVFASVSCIQKGLNPLETKLAVVADTKRQGSVVLATPKLKEIGIKTGSRLFEIPHRNDIYIINPSMRKYLEVSIAISKIALKYVPGEDLHQYSIDEFFLDVTDSYHRFNSTVQSFAERLQKEIEDKTGIYCTIGIGSNMLLSKVAMDIEAKHTSNGITEWRYHDVPQKCGKLRHYVIFGALTRKQKQSSIRKGL